MCNIDSNFNGHVPNDYRRTGVSRLKEENKFFKKCIIAFIVGVVSICITFPVSADDNVNFAFSTIDDGSCEDTLSSLVLGYRHESEDRSAYGSVRQAPSGGDCRVDSVSYTVEVEQRFDFGFGVDGMVKIGADERSVAAGYGILDVNDALLTRADGRPASPVMLPSGRAFTLTGVIGGSVSYGQFDFDFGYNVAGVDWADGSNSNTVHLAASTTYEFFDGELLAGISYDRGNFGYGDFRASWSREIADTPWSVVIEVTSAFGLTKLDAGIPAMQEFAGLNAMLLPGSAKDTSSTLSIGFEVSI